MSEQPAGRPTATGSATMRWESVCVREENPRWAAEQAAHELLAAIGPGSIDLVLAFFTANLVRGAEEMRKLLETRLAPGCIAGVSGAGVISRTEEIEGGTALVLVAARLPGVTVSPFVLPAASWSSPPQESGEFAHYAPGALGSEAVLLFGDPFSLDVLAVLDAFHRFAPGLRVVGGMASAGRRADENGIFLNDWNSSEGGFAIAFSGAIRADVVVSQGCRAVGPPLLVTRADRNLILELDGKPAADRVREVFHELTDREQAAARQGLLLGRPALQGAEARGEYLIRNVLGHDPKTGVLAVGDMIHQRERVRLHARDAGMAREDLELLLAPQAFDSPASAALLFACNGRGRHLYSEPNGDVATLQSALGATVPIAGFFCAGEIGPVGERNFVHGQTASIAIVRPA